MDVKSFFPMWNQLTSAQKNMLNNSAIRRTLPAGAILQGGKDNCNGLVLVQSGQLRAFITSQDGREITIYRLLNQDICIFSASCMMRSIQFEIMIEAEEDTVIISIPTDVYHALTKESAAIANFTNELMAERFSEVIWLMEHILWMSFDKRLAAFLLEESNLKGSALLKLTHETIARHMGTAREVVTRMLKYFQSEGWVKLSRGMIEITNIKKLKEMC